MNPNQQRSPTPEPGANPYEFITNNSKPPRRPLLGGDSFVKKIVIITGGAVLLMMVMAIVLSMFGGSGNTSALKSLVAEQEELVRVAGVGAAEAQDSTIRARAKTTELSTGSQQQALTRYLEGMNIKLDKNELAANKNAATDEALEAAGISNRFDEVFIVTLNDLLRKYARNLQTAHSVTTDEDAKQILSDSYDSTVAIIGSDAAEQ